MLGQIEGNNGEGGDGAAADGGACPCCQALGQCWLRVREPVRNAALLGARACDQGWRAGGLGDSNLGVLYLGLYRGMLLRFDFNSQAAAPANRKPQDFPKFR